MQVTFILHIPFARKMQNYGDGFSSIFIFFYFQCVFVCLLSVLLCIVPVPLGAIG